MTMSDNEWQQVEQIWQRVTTSGTTSDNEWYNEWQRMTTTDIKWQRVTKNDNEWQRVIQRLITNKNEWQRVKQRMQTNESEWNQVKENEFGFGMKLNMQCITTIYSAIQIIYKLGNWRHIFSIHILCFYHACISSCFSLSVLLKLIKAF